MSVEVPHADGVGPQGPDGTPSSCYGVLNDLCLELPANQLNSDKLSMFLERVNKSQYHLIPAPGTAYSGMRHSSTMASRSHLTTGNSVSDIALGLTHDSIGEPSTIVRFPRKVVQFLQTVR